MNLKRTGVQITITQVVEIFTGSKTWCRWCKPDTGAGELRREDATREYYERSVNAVWVISERSDC